MHAWIQELSSSGSRPNGQKKILTFFLPELILQTRRGIFHNKYDFPRFQGAQLQIPMETYSNCDFLRGDVQISEWTLSTWRTNVLSAGCTLYSPGSRVKAYK